MPSIDFTIAFDEPDEDCWIGARVLEAPGTLSQARTREETASALPRSELHSACNTAACCSFASRNLVGSLRACLTTR